MLKCFSSLDLGCIVLFLCPLTSTAPLFMLIFNCNLKVPNFHLWDFFGVLMFFITKLGSTMRFLLVHPFLVSGLVVLSPLKLPPPTPLPFVWFIFIFTTLKFWSHPLFIFFFILFFAKLQAPL